MNAGSPFLQAWAEAASTSVGLFWMALWAFVLGYAISSMIQVFVTRERMRLAMGEEGPKSVALGTVFGFLSSSCSFSALSTTRALFTKGAGLVPSLAFLLASTNLVIELGIVIAVFLAWQFVAAEYIGGLLLIALMWVMVRLTLPARLEDAAREHAEAMSMGSEDEAPADWKDLALSAEGWRRVARTYLGEWAMVWKDVTIGFTVAGIVTVFVPRAFFEALFVGSGGDPSFPEVVAQALVGPLAAFFTFIGSMGNIPLAAVLFGNGVSFAGVMAFIFSDLVVFPVVRIQASYYGWRMALYITGVFLVVLVSAAVAMHYGFAAFGALPSAEGVGAVSERAFFAVDYTMFLDIAALALSGLFAWLALRGERDGHHGDGDVVDRVLFWVAMLAYAWLGVGLVLRLVL